MTRPRLWHCCLLLVCAIRYGSAAEPTVRVALLLDQPGITLAGTAFGCATDPAAALQIPAVNQLHHATVIRAVAGGLQVGQQIFSSATLWCYDAGHALYANTTALPDTVQLIAQLDQTPPSITIVATLLLEAYVAGVVGSEMQAGWPLEALKAQAIIARSYTVAKLQQATPPSKDYDLTADTGDQMFSGRPPDPTVLRAVTETTGQLVRDAQQRIFLPHYHSCCGGHTVPAQHVWPEAAALEQTVRDPYCARCPAIQWRLQISHAQLAAALEKGGYITPPVTKISGDAREKNARQGIITLETAGAPLSLPANTFRRILGFDQLKSTQITIRATRTGWQFAGTGYGHGVGLCQWGAKAQAEQGRTAAQILEFYYPGSSVGRE